MTRSTASGQRTRSDDYENEKRKIELEQQLLEIQERRLDLEQKRVELELKKLTLKKPKSKSGKSSRKHRSRQTAREDSPDESEWSGAVKEGPLSPEVAASDNEEDSRAAVDTVTSTDNDDRRAPDESDYISKLSQRSFSSQDTSSVFSTGSSHSQRSEASSDLAVVANNGSTGRRRRGMSDNLVVLDTLRGRRVMRRSSEHGAQTATAAASHISHNLLAYRHQSMRDLGQRGMKRATSRGRTRRSASIDCKPEPRDSSADTRSSTKTTKISNQSNHKPSGDNAIPQMIGSIRPSLAGST